MKPKSWNILIFLLIIISIEGRKLSKGRGSSRGSSRRVGNPSPTSLSYPQPSVPKPQPKPSLFGWQEQSAHKTRTSQSSQSKKPTQTHSYPSSQTGLSGNTPPKQPVNQQNIQKSSASNAQAPQSSKPSSGHSYPSIQTGLSGNSPAKSSVNQESIQRSSNVPSNNAQVPHANAQNPSYPSSNGLSGSGSDAKYPQRTGLSGTGNAAAPPPYSPGNSYGPGQHYPNNAGQYNSGYHNQQGPPPPYGGYSSYGGYNNYGGYGGGNPGGMYNSPMHQMPGYYGNYGKGFGGVSRSGSALTGVGIAGAGIGTLLTGLALWNLARSTGNHRHTVIYERGQPVGVAPANNTEPVVSDLLGELVNCSLTVSSNNSTEILMIPCAIATSFTPDADVKDVDAAKDPNDTTRCIVTVVTKTGKEYMTTIPCSILLKTAAENNVTEAPIIESETFNGTVVDSNITNENLIHGQSSVLQTNTSNIETVVVNEPSALALSAEESLNISKAFNCTLEPGDIRDPINPCFSVQHNLTVIPLVTEINTESPISTTSGAA